MSSLSGDIEKHVRIHQALSDKNRMSIIKLLANGELCACKINEYFRITQPTLSHHMRVLCDAGLVLGRRDGIWMHYRINKQLMYNLSQCFVTLANSKDGINTELQGECCCEDAQELNSIQTLE